MLYQAYSFNGVVSKWDVSKVRDTNSMFYEASNFNNDVSKWDTSSVEDMNGRFYQAGLNGMYRMPDL